MTNWRSSVTAILGLYDVNNTTPFSSCVDIIQNTVLYREHEQKREKSKQRALTERRWMIRRYICNRDHKSVYIWRISRKDNITCEWYDVRMVSHQWYHSRRLYLLAQWSHVEKRRSFEDPDIRWVLIGSIDFQRIPGRNFAELSETFPAKTGPESCSKEILGTQRSRPKINGIYGICCRKTKKTIDCGGRNSGPGLKQLKKEHLADLGEFFIQN